MVEICCEAVGECVVADAGSRTTRWRRMEIQWLRVVAVEQATKRWRMDGDDKDAMRGPRPSLSAELLGRAVLAGSAGWLMS